MSWQSSLLSPKGESVSQQAKVQLLSFYSWNLGTLHSPTSRNPKELIEWSIAHSLCNPGYHNNQAILISSINKRIVTKIIVIYLLWPMIPPLWRIREKLSPKFLILGCMNHRNWLKAQKLKQNFHLIKGLASSFMQFGYMSTRTCLTMTTIWNQ